MQLKLITKLKNAFQTLSSPISICKNCFDDIDMFSPFSFINKEPVLCKKCIQEFNPKFRIFKIDGVKALTLYDYDVFMKDLIYKLKGCFDYELKNAFLAMYRRELSLLFKGYTMIPAPSYKQDDIVRGFNHVIEIFKMLNLPMIEAFEKTEHFKQADHNFKERKLISKYLKIKDEVQLPNKVLLVDDILTTGSTMSSMISLLKSKGIKDIKLLVLCKTMLEEKSDKHLMQ